MLVIWWFCRVYGRAEGLGCHEVSGYAQEDRHFGMCVAILPGMPARLPVKEVPRWDVLPPPARTLLGLRLFLVPTPTDAGPTAEQSETSTRSEIVTR